MKLPPWLWLALGTIAGVSLWQASRRGRPRIGRSYYERHRLPDGRWVTIRWVRPSDKRHFERALREASDRTIYQRFFTIKRRFSEAELRYLTEFDGWNHVAIGVTTGIGVAERPLGVARFVRSAHAPDRAEAAVALMDEAQGKGLGLRLFVRLAWAAWERGVRVLECPILAANRASLALMRRLDPYATTHPDGAVVVVHLDLRRVMDRFGR